LWSVGVREGSSTVLRRKESTVGEPADPMKSQAVGLPNASGKLNRIGKRRKVKCAKSKGRSGSPEYGRMHAWGRARGRRLALNRS